MIGPLDTTYAAEHEADWRPADRVEVGPLVLHVTAPEGEPLTYVVPEVAADGYTHSTPDLTHPSNARPSDPVAAAITWR